jgi:hypothetical protein
MSEDSRLKKRLAMFTGGGQLEIEGEDYLYRGEISTVTVKGRRPNRILSVKFSWERMRREEQWVDSDAGEEPYEVPLGGSRTYALAGECFRIKTDAEFGSETLVFFPKNHHSTVEFRKQHAPKPA